MFLWISCILSYGLLFESVKSQTCNYAYGTAYQCANSLPWTGCSQNGWACHFGYKTFYNTSVKTYVLDSQGAYCQNKDHYMSAGYGYCHAQSDCSEINYFNLTVWRTFTCEGLNSCYKSKMSIWSVTCYGEGSCKDTTIMLHTTSGNKYHQIDGKGAYSLMNAKIDTATDKPSYPFRLYAYGYYSMYNSTLLCANNHTCIINCIGNACYNMHFVCNNSVSNCTVICDENDGVSCPNWYNNSHDIVYDNGKTIEMISDSVKIADLTEIWCNDENAISADNSEEMKSQTSITSSDGDGTTNICGRARYSTAYVTNMMNNCTSYNESNIVCGGYLGCYDNGNMISNHGSIYCEGNSACASVTKMKANDTIHCGGHGSCSSSKFYDAKNVYCTAQGACNSVTMYNIENVYILSYSNSMNIISNGLTRMNVYLLANIASSVSITCSVGDSCYIECGTNDACSSAYVYCNSGDCEINCDESNGIECPIATPSMAPTKKPTSLPSNIPTVPSAYPSETPTLNPSDMPSVLPSRYPSNNPSQVPTSIPTAIPTLLPSSIPTHIPSLPSLNPTNVPSSPTMIPSLDPTDEPSIWPTNFPSSNPIVTTIATISTSENIVENEENTDNSDNNNDQISLSLSSTNVQILVISVAGIFVCLICGCWFFSYKYFKMKHESEISQLQNSVKSKTSSPFELSINSDIGGQIRNNNYNNNKMIMNNGATLGKDKDYKNETNKDEMDEEESHSKLYASQDDNNTGGAVGAGGIATEGVNDDEADNNTTMVFSTTNGAHTGQASETNYMQWNETQVLNWVNSILSENGLCDQRVESFIKEFSTKAVSGKTLNLLKNDKDMLNQFKNDFSKQNQAFGIWIALSSSVETIGH